MKAVVGLAGGIAVFVADWIGVPGAEVLWPERLVDQEAGDESAVLQGDEDRLVPSLIVFEEHVNNLRALDLFRYNLASLESIFVHLVAFGAFYVEYPELLDGSSVDD